MSMAIADELLALRNDNGVINPAHVVVWAKDNPASRLHASLEWDDSLAAERWRREQVRTLIAVHVVDADGSRKLISLSIDRTASGGYRPIDEVMNSTSLREVMLKDALSELDRVQKKYEKLQELERVWTAASRVREGRASRRKAAA
jgi:hypothetical protein